MEPGPNKSGEASTPAASPSALLTWPIGVQIALSLIVTANLFFLLGRWSQEAPRSRPELAAEAGHVGPAIDLNRATKAELRLIPGIGDALAQRVIDHRLINGPFRSVNELRQVAGIGPKTLDRLRHRLFVTPGESFESDDEDEGMATTGKPVKVPRTSSASKKVAQLTEPINVNRASQADLQKLPGIGPKLSQRMLDERAKAAFKSIDDLRRVPGIGPKTLEKLRPYITIGEPRTLALSAEE
jgi:competence protein ComEA